MSGGTATFSDVIGDNAGSRATGTDALTKSGAGTQTLTGVNIHTGGTLNTGAFGTNLALALSPSTAALWR